MGVEIVNSRRIDRRVAQSVTHRKSSPRPVFWRRRDVIRITTHAKADQLSVDLRATATRVLELLEHQGATAVGCNEAVAITIPGTRGTLRVVIALR